MSDMNEVVIKSLLTNSHYIIVLNASEIRRKEAYSELQLSDKFFPLLPKDLPYCLVVFQPIQSSFPLYFHAKIRWLLRYGISIVYLQMIKVVSIIMAKLKFLDLKNT